ncbi:hypothetical protein L0222_32495 [bacterium]|nr:hypothetical protein [bacterium]
MSTGTSTNEVKYYTRWVYPNAVGPLTIKTAKKRHDAGQLYTAVVGPPDRVSCYIQVRFEAGYVGVGFLDDNNREYLTYSFKVIDNNRMFLSTAHFHEFEENQDSPARSTNFYFETDGRVTIEEIDRASKSIKRKQGEFKDLSPNWETVPDFGHYEHLLRTDRNIRLRN